MSENGTPRTMTYRDFGRSGEKVSAIGIGGFHLGVPKDPDIAVEIVRTALDGGITFCDCAWDYHSGESERRLGRALEGGYREKAFLMTKLDSRTAEGTMRQIEESLTRLRTDHVDLVQLHEVIRPGEPEEALREGGVIEAYRTLKEQGLARYIGFTGHKDPAIHRQMIELALERGVVLDSVQMPVNAFDASYRSFTREVLPLAVDNGIAVIGMKPLGAGKLVGRAALEAADLLRWSLSQPVAVLVTGCESVEDVQQAISVASAFEPLTEAELRRIEQKAAPLAADGAYEAYKTSDTHDSTSKNPQWRD